MMSSYASSSSKIPSESYDVFISFRGEDTRSNFISHLYDALTRESVRTYKDDKSLEIGNFIAPSLLEAIETSRFAVVVLSSSFATSKWCLEEIAKVVDCMEQGKLIVVPVFYHVSPSDVRHQSGCFLQGFANHEVDPEISLQKVQTWRYAFEKVGNISGLHVTPNRSESEIVTEIVQRIVKEMHVTLPMVITDGLVGIDSRANEVRSMLLMESSDVRFIAICGMSGIGKTTLAEVVYKRIQGNFQRSSFIENIKDVSKKNDSTTLCKLQEKILYEILKDNIHVQSVAHGQTLLGTKLRGFKVIIVLDDVNHLDQLTYLAGSRKWFGPGTRIIITTTNNDLMDQDIIDEIYTCEELKHDEALRLFCQSAFKKEHPTHGYEKLSDDIVKLAGGLPLALNVYGSILCQKEENYWKDMLKKLGEYPHEEVLGRLETVYARLDRDQRMTFVYIACFLKGRNIHLVKDILTNVGLYPECGIPDLINKFLVTINHDDSVWVHDLLQQMCWEVLRKESERHGGNHIAIKYRKNVEDILSLEPEGTRTIEIINQEPYKLDGADFYDDNCCFSKMMKLKFLRISKINCQQGLNRLSNELRILQWYGCSLKSLPSMFKPNQIFELEMCYSQLEILWEKDVDLPNLRSINLSFSKDLLNIPNVMSALNLVKLNLEGCTKLTELHESILLHKSIRYLNLKGCTRLQSFGRSIMEMEALEALVVSGCSSLQYLPEFGQNMKRLEHLYVDGTLIKRLPNNLGKMCDLRKLDASGTCIEELPSSIHHLNRLRLICVHRCRLSLKSGGFLVSDLDSLSSGLRELDLSYCNLSVVPDSIGLLYHLINLDLSGNDFVSLPASISLLSNLRMLCMNNCKRLQSLPKLSIVNEDTLYGLSIRFSYYISGEGVDVSKFHATSNNPSPTVSCLNCPKLAENEHGGSLAEKLLNSYLQIRTKYWITPEAVFEIVGAGRVIGAGFKGLRCDKNVIHRGPWVGVAIFLGVHPIDAFLEANYMGAVHIHVGEKHWKIPVSINFLVKGLGNQLVLYWTVADDLQRIVGSNQEHNFHFSFCEEPGDGNLLVTSFGVRFICDEDILQLKRHEFSTNRALEYHVQNTLYFATDMQWLLSACEADMDCRSIIHEITSSIIRFIPDCWKKGDVLHGVHKIIKCLTEFSQQLVVECKEEWGHTFLFPLVYDYYRIGRVTSQLWDDFVRFLKDINDSWLSVKFALEQIVAKSRADDYTYEEMVQQLNDLEAAESVRLSRSFISSFACICKQIVAFSRRFDREIQGNIEFEAVKVLVKVSRMTIMGILSVVASYMCNSELLQESGDANSYSMWLQVIQSFRGRSAYEPFRRDFQICDFYGNSVLLQELKNKMARSTCINDAKTEEMMICTRKLEKKINDLSVTIEDMSFHASKYSHLMRQQELMTSNPVTGLLVTKYGVCFIPDEDMHLMKPDSASEAFRIVYRATLSLVADLPWKLCVCHADDHQEMDSCHSIINDCTSSIIKLILNYETKWCSLDGIHIIFEFLHEINQEGLSMLNEVKYYWSPYSADMLNIYYDLSDSIFKLYQDFTSFLADVSESWSSLKQALEQIVVKRRAGDHTYEDIVAQLSDFEIPKSGLPSYISFAGSFHSSCGYTDKFLQIMLELAYVKLKDFESIKKVTVMSLVTIAAVCSVLATYRGDSILSEALSYVTSKWNLLGLIKELSITDGNWFDKEEKLMRRSNDDGGMEMWDFDGTAVVGELKKKMALHGCFTREIGEEVLVLIEKLDKNIINFSETIKEMCVHAEQYSSEITRTRRKRKFTLRHPSLTFK